MVCLVEQTMAVVVVAVHTALSHKSAALAALA
jgi:hypothetical protein